MQASANVASLLRVRGFLPLSYLAAARAESELGGALDATREARPLTAAAAESFCGVSFSMDFHQPSHSDTDCYLNAVRLHPDIISDRCSEKN